MEYLWIYTSIAGALLGAACLAYIRDTRIGLWGYSKFDQILDWLRDRYGWTWFDQDPEAWKKVNPKIAIAVIVENAGFGATWAGPIASLMIEQYLKDTIASNRKGIEANMFNAKLISSYTYLIDSARRKKDRAIWDKKQALKNSLLKERSTFKTLLETSKKTGLH